MPCVCVRLRAKKTQRSSMVVLGLRMAACECAASLGLLPCDDPCHNNV